MASDEKTGDPEVAKEVEAPPPPPKAEQPPPPPSATTEPPPRTPLDKCIAVDVALRVVLFAATLTALLVLVTSKQTKFFPVPGIPVPVPVEAKFNQSPAFIYFAAALAVACFYSIITSLASISVILKPALSTSFLLFFAISDVVVLGLVASATGAAGGVAYIGLKGNSHTMWMKVCNRYGKYCQHVGGSLAASLLASFVLVFLVILSIVSLHKKIPK